jgi:pimeloyl-ACP methyl ester carboxylesterase
MPTARLNEIDIYYQEQGRGYPVVLTHGLGDCADLWTGLGDALADTCRVVSWDMRGHYRSDAPDDLALYTQDIVVEDLRALCDHLGIERAVQGGHSLGGYTAMRFYEKYPERVSALILHAAGPGYRNKEGSQGWTDTLAKLAARQESEYGRNEQRLAKELRVGAPAFGETVRHYVRGVANVERGVMAHPSFIDATTIDVPTLVIVGERDKNYLASAGYFEQKLPRATRITVEDAGHPAVLEQPAVVHKAVHDFLEGLRLT